MFSMILKEETQCCFFLGSLRMAGSLSYRLSQMVDRQSPLLLVFFLTTFPEPVKTYFRRLFS